MGLRPMKGDESLAEVQVSRSPFDELADGRVADWVNVKSEAFDRAGGVSGRLLEFYVGQPILAAAGFQPAPRIMTNVRRAA
jgi:hypothetical protein